MERVPQVEAAKALMSEAMTWSVMKWLREKKRVRSAADEANAALDHLRQEVHKRWSAALQSQYTAVAAEAKAGLMGRSSRKNDGVEQVLLQQLRKADQEALNAREDAEKTFDDAERQLSTRMARDGCQKAIRSWELHEKAIQKAEGLARSK